MTKFYLYIFLFSIFVSSILSDPNSSKTALKGVQKEVSSSNTTTSTVSTISTVLTEKNAVISNQNDNSKKTIVEEKAKIVDEKEQAIPKESKIVDAETNKLGNTPIQRNGEDSADPKCGNTFIMWFGHGVALTTVKCEKYTEIYSGAKDGSPKTRYISGEVNEITIESESSIKVDGKDINTISTSADSPTAGGDRLLSRKERSLSTSTEAEPEGNVQSVKVYSFKIGGKEFEVMLPNDETAANRKQYSLAQNGEIFYSNSEQKSEYSINEKGDLLTSGGEVILKGDSSSSAIKTVYIIPSLIAGFILTILI